MICLGSTVRASASNNNANKEADEGGVRNDEDGRAKSRRYGEPADDGQHPRPDDTGGDPLLDGRGTGGKRRGMCLSVVHMTIVRQEIVLR